MQIPTTTDPNLKGLFVRNIGLDLVLTVLTCGLFNIYVQYKQMQALNYLLGKPKYEFVSWALLCAITCGLYHIYHEYRKSSDLAILLKDTNSLEPIITIVLTVMAFSIVADAIQQYHINRYFGHQAL